MTRLTTCGPAARLRVATLASSHSATHGLYLANTEPTHTETHRQPQSTCVPPSQQHYSYACTLTADYQCICVPVRGLTHTLSEAGLSGLN